MKEFMLLIRNEGDGKAGLDVATHLAFVKQCEVYIEALKKEKRLIAAQPLLREGTLLKADGEKWKEAPLDSNGNIQVGYYHILAENLADAIAVAKRNPEFAYVPSATIEVRAIKMKEEQTAFVYPNQAS